MPPAQAAVGKFATWRGVPQWRVALLVGAGFALGALPVAMHAMNSKEGVESPYAASKKRQREERFAWYESDEMPPK
jgi:hypothetical protein